LQEHGIRLSHPLTPHVLITVPLLVCQLIGEYLSKHTIGDSYHI
jgi:hypothetical protein